MKQELQKFAQQLALWTELTIENGRTPFRRVDLCPTIYTDQGILHPPLVFWINRQSMMAGGILLLPEQDLEMELKNGCSCCDALGLKHFVTWEIDRVRIWQVCDGAAQQHQQFELVDTDHPDAFRHLLGDVLEELKLLAVIGLIRNDQLSAHYLHNLFQTTLELAQPALTNSYRSQRAEKEIVSRKDADQLAQEANRLLLLQLLSLAWHQQLPSAILPEKLERAIQLSLPQLPGPLEKTLSVTVSVSPPELPNEAAVCFHHLLLRLQQLSWRQDEHRAAESIYLLINSWKKNHSELPGQILLYPESPCVGPQAELIISDSPSLLAAIRLSEDLQQKKPLMLLLGNLFQFSDLDRRELEIYGTLNHSRLLSKEERQQYTALLRTSWPNRRFRIGGDKPLWFWELIHLLGLSRRQRLLVLTLPLQAILTSVRDPFWQLVWESYSIRQVRALADDLISLQLSPEAKQDAPVSICRKEEHRSFLPSGDLPRFRNQLLLTLLLPPEIYQLFDDKLTWPDLEKLTCAAETGLGVYLQSRLSQKFEQILGLNLTNLSAEEHQQELQSFPQPDQLLLQELGRSPDKDPDQFLAELLASPELATFELPKEQKKNKDLSLQRPDKNLREELVQELRKTGIPNFPEQYLYFLDQADTTTYRLTPPLEIKSELLGEIELEDAAGRKFLVYGEELANTLLLCSALGKTEVELPADRQHLALLQKQYGKDLKLLHKQLSSLCHSRLQNPKAAEKMANKVWKQLNLPKPRLLYQLR